MHIALPLFTALVGALWSATTMAQSMRLSISSDDFIVSPVFSDVSDFAFTLDIDAAMASGLFVNPPLTQVIYRVSGTLADGTPSMFPAFNLERSITGEEFYAQGSSLRFEIAETAVLSDGVQVSELVADQFALILNAREIDNGRFHPPLLTLSANGSGRILNTNNVPTLEPELEIQAGAEYISDLIFDPGNTSVIISADSAMNNGGGGSGKPSGLLAIMLLLATGFRIAATHIRLAIE